MGYQTSNRDWGTSANSQTQPNQEKKIMPNSQGCALTVPGRLRRLKLDFGRLKNNSGRPTGHSCLKSSSEVKQMKDITVFKPSRKILWHECSRSFTLKIHAEYFPHDMGLMFTTTLHMKILKITAAS